MYKNIIFKKSIKKYEKQYKKMVGVRAGQRRHPLGVRVVDSEEQRARLWAKSAHLIKTKCIKNE
jgi:hypothetical protein